MVFKLESRYSEAAERVLALADKIARGRGDNYRGVEHLMIAVLEDQKDLPAQALESMGISPQSVIQQIDEMTGRGTRPYKGKLETTPSFKKALKMAHMQSYEFGGGIIEPAHIFLGLLHEGEGLGCVVLKELVFDLCIISTRVELLLADKADPSGEKPIGEVFPMAIFAVHYPTSAEHERQLLPVLEALLVRVRKRAGVSA